MTIRIEAYDRLPAAARAIREQVFIRERDWLYFVKSVFRV